MAVSSSGLFINTFKKCFDGTDLVLDWVNDTVKCALFTNSITPNFSTDASYNVSPYNANQVSGTGYTTGGVTMAGKTLTESPTGSLMFDGNDVQWSGATFSGARAALIWDDTQTSPVDAVVCLVNLNADYGVTAGTFTIQWATTGIFAIDITP